MSTASGILVRIHDLLSFIDSLAFRLCAQFRRISVRRSARISLTGSLKTQRHTPSTDVCQHSTTLPISQLSLVPLARHVSLPRALGYQIRWATKRGSPWRQSIDDTACVTSTGLWSRRQRSASNRITAITMHTRQRPTASSWNGLEFCGVLLAPTRPRHLHSS
jgi:hypothetical protein